MPFAELKDDVKIHYNLRGKGVGAGSMTAGAALTSAAILMACQAEGYNPDAEMSDVRTTLSANRPTLNYSYRGSGQSSIPTSLDQYSVAHYREDTRQLAAQAGLSRFSLVGYSHGGYFAADYALNYPEQVDALVLVEPALFVDRAKLQDRINLTRQGDGEGAIHLLMKQMMPEMAFNSPEYADLVAAIKKNYPDPIGLAGEWYARATYELAEAELSRMRVPTLVIGGERSWVRENIARAARAIPGAQLVWLDGTHNLWEERPAEVAGAIESFLSAHSV